MSLCVGVGVSLSLCACVCVCVCVPRVPVTVVAAEHVDNVINESINIVKEHEEYCQTENMVS